MSWNNENIPPESKKRFKHLGCHSMQQNSVWTTTLSLKCVAMGTTIFFLYLNERLCEADFWDLTRNKPRSSELCIAEWSRLCRSNVSTGIKREYGNVVPHAFVSSSAVNHQCRTGRLIRKWLHNPIVSIRSETWQRRYPLTMILFPILSSIPNCRPRFVGKMLEPKYCPAV